MQNLIDESISSAIGNLYETTQSEIDTSEFPLIHDDLFSLMAHAALTVFLASSDAQDYFELNNE